MSIRTLVAEANSVIKESKGRWPDKPNEKQRGSFLHADSYLTALADTGEMDSYDTSEYRVELKKAGYDPDVITQVMQNHGFES